MPTYSLVLGRLASQVATLLRGKHKPIFAPPDTGDHVVVVNAPKVVLTADKAATKEAIRHSRHPGGLRRQAYGDLLDHGRQPPRTVEPPRVP